MVLKGCLLDQPMFRNSELGQVCISVGSMQEHPWLHTEVSINLGKTRPCLKTNVDTHDDPFPQGSLHALTPIHVQV